jgi:hypothetical protein
MGGGAPANVTETLHRIGPTTVRREVEAAGFKFDGESLVLANPADPRTASVFDTSIRGHADQFHVQIPEAAGVRPSGRADSRLLRTATIINLENTMNLSKPIGVSLLLCTLGYLSQSVPALSQTPPAAVDKGPQRTGAERDGQHDFDFEIGAWRTHLRRLVHPLTASTTWVEYEGTSVVRKLWNGRANLVELEVDGSGGHIEGLSLRLYNPQSHQWSLNFANSKGGTLGVPTVGEFKDGRGEFFDQETFNGRTILVRNIWSDITPDSCHFEQSFSDDGGKTWEVNWIATDTRVKENVDKPH